MKALNALKSLEVLHHTLMQGMPLPLLLRPRTNHAHSNPCIELSMDAICSGETQRNLYFLFENHREPFCGTVSKSVPFFTLPIVNCPGTASICPVQKRLQDPSDVRIRSPDFPLF